MIATKTSGLKLFAKKLVPGIGGRVKVGEL